MSDYQLDENCIQWFNEKVNWQEAIALSAAPLIKKGAVTREYAEAMVENINQLGPYILIAPNVALPHARPENGVKEAGIALTVFQEDVEFPADSSGEEKQARVFICLAAVDSESHLNMLQKISGWIDNQGLINSLLNAASQEETKQLLQSSKN
ncbi:PTS sugar transporter subunit IIA [Alkalicoccus saliphilus]|jgi:mannitol/fructose-specific phosphotransferase system IIA component (Ntr-type)|uniref:Ascorbate-specific PTS system EIIA component n=1 Tax=Alkalicoccus saliphilus TaxID=200989 RepID=A0A2T4U3G7_9BACI|nr:PTS sugar transporter subunit IIA [Alkalicoccus saliphilus]PTL37944.1 PTS sugar transporter subunit IIA [Alkalicoccus saliphilus]